MGAATQLVLPGKISLFILVFGVGSLAGVLLVPYSTYAKYQALESKRQWHGNHLEWIINAREMRTNCSSMKRPQQLVAEPALFAR